MSVVWTLVRVIDKIEIIIFLSHFYGTLSLLCYPTSDPEQLAYEEDEHQGRSFQFCLISYLKSLQIENTRGIHTSTNAAESLAASYLLP